MNLYVLNMLGWLEFSPPTSEAAGSNLGLGASCWKVGSHLPMPGGLQCSMHWFPPPVNYLSQYDPERLQNPPDGSRNMLIDI